MNRSYKLLPWKGEDGTVLLSDLRQYLSQTSLAMEKFETITENTGETSPHRSPSRASVASVTSQLESTTAAIVDEEGPEIRLTFDDFVARVRARPDLAEPILHLTATVASGLTAKLDVSRTTPDHRPKSTVV